MVTCYVTTIADPPHQHSASVPGMNLITHSVVHSSVFGKKSPHVCSGNFLLMYSELSHNEADGNAERRPLSTVLPLRNAGPHQSGMPSSLLQRHMEAELRRQAGITSVHQDFDYRKKAWLYQDINLALFIFIQMPLGAGGETLSQP